MEIETAPEGRRPTAGLSRRGLLEVLLAGIAFLAGRFSIQSSHPTAPAGPPAEEFTASVEAFLQSLLPDGRLPGYRTSGILAPLLGQFAPGTHRHRFAVELVQRLDLVARRIHRRSFRELKPGDRAMVVTEVERDEVPGFILLRSAALELHYSHADVWTALSFPGPPQPSGYQDFDRAPRI